MINASDLNSLSPKESQEVSALFLKQSLYHFAHFLGYTEVNIETHGEIIASLESLHPRKLVVVPRGAFKSSLGSIVYPIWCLLRNPNDRILIDSEIYSNSVLYLRVIKEHIKSDEFMSVFGDLEGSVWQEGAITINTRTKKYKEPTITCGGVGTTRVGMHYNRIIADDYNSPANTRTKELAQGVIDHFKYNLNILEPDGEYVIIGTRYSEDDLIGFVLREILGQKSLSEGKFDRGLLVGG
jgi:hypothetical protein